MKITFALSGGGFRASVFHLGVIARLACEDQLENVILLSTVSGGSLCAGLVYALNGFEWPGSQVFLERIEPRARQLITSIDMQGQLIRRVLGTFWTLLETRADDLSTLLKKNWNVTASLKDLPSTPRWMINATCYETGKNWRFERFRMGDYMFGYTNDTDVPLSDAMAASAGFPGLIGALNFNTGGRQWFQYQDNSDAIQKLALPEEEQRWTKVSIQPKYPTVHLWDGGVYDNHGLEGIHNFETGWSKRFGFLIVSDAAGRSGEEIYRKGIPAIMRLSTGIMMNQVRSLRTRAILERLQNHKMEDQGVFLQMGHTCQNILKNSNHLDWLPAFQAGAMPEADVMKAFNTPTTIRKLTIEEYECLYQHGYEVANTTLHAYYPADFDNIPYHPK
jgi:NTE family protein